MIFTCDCPGFERGSGVGYFELSRSFLVKGFWGAICRLMVALTVSCRAWLLMMARHISAGSSFDAVLTAFAMISASAFFNRYLRLKMVAPRSK
jgi:hypothetical protein